MQAAEEDLRRFIGLLEASSQMDIESWSRNVQVDSRKSRQVRAEINEWRPVIEAYAREIGPDYLEALRVGLDSANGAGIPAAQRLLGAMTKQERIDAVIGQQGPKLAAVGMHQWVWVPAAPAWDVGHRRDAVQRACTSVFDTELRSKVGRYNMQSLDLVGHVFHPDAPGKGDVRLRIPGYVADTPEWRDVHKGARDFGMGCVAMIRNLTTHSLDEPPEAVALEALAALSYFARYVDDAVVDEG